MNTPTCVSRDSNPGRNLGRVASYPWTTDAAPMSPLSRHLSHRPTCSPHLRASRHVHLPLKTPHLTTSHLMYNHVFLAPHTPLHHTPPLHNSHTFELRPSIHRTPRPSIHLPSTRPSPTHNTASHHIPPHVQSRLPCASHPSTPHTPTT